MGDERKGLLSFIKQLFQSDENHQRQSKFRVYVGVLLVLGIALMVFGGFSKSPQNEADIPVSTSDEVTDSESEPTFGKEDNSEPSSISEYERSYENELKEILEAVIGVDGVQVMVNLDASESKVFGTNKTIQSQTTDETDQEGGKRQVKDRSEEVQIVVIRSNDQEKAVVVKTEKPKVRGVLVVAEGAENIRVEQRIKDAVTKVLDVPVHRVSVLPKKLKGES
jgi:stage III sporulation protein AG